MHSAYKFIKFHTTTSYNRLNLNLTKVTINKYSKDIFESSIKKFNYKNYAILGATESHALPIKLNQPKIAINSKNN
tara:strand:- start:423 stop:650 length:228 start_codon:yes stop_codon:yes gene_type:complete